MSVLIGLVDQKIHEPDSVGWDTNKIGGLPKWIVGESSSSSIPECKNCGQVSTLVMQIYCPLGGSPYHRCIYLFMCPGVCSRQQIGWRVFRSMKLDSSYQDEANQAVKTSTKCGGELWTQEQDDWGEESDDWGEESHECVGNVDHCCEQQDKRRYIQEIASGQKETDCSMAAEETAEDEVNEHSVVHSVPDSDVSNSDLQNLESLSQLTLSDDTDSSYSHAGEVDGGSGLDLGSVDDYENVIEPTLDEVIGFADADRFNALAKLLNTKLKQDTGPTASVSPVVFESYYLSVLDEPAKQPDIYGDHINNLIRNYEISEGKQLHLLMSERPKHSKGKEGATELYESTNLRHGDKIFYKFLKRLERCPEQCIRYDRGGDPLLVGSLQDQSVNPCPFCGGKRIFEVQLLPSLIPFLKAQNGRPCEVDFGTVLVFTCERNCWPAEHNPAQKIDVLEESIILQTDPDNHLYR